MSDNLSNEHRAAVFELTVPCNNNIALCSINLQNYGEAILYANNGLLLTSALESRVKSNSEVWKVLQEKFSMTLEKLLGKFHLLSL